MTSTENTVIGTDKPADKPAEKPAEKNNDKRRALGRGLDSLLPGPRAVVPAAAADNSLVIAEMQAVAARGESVRDIPLDQIDKNPHQTRYDFNDEALTELADSIRENGVVQPVLLRSSEDGRYILVLGERRCRASKMAGKETVPAIVRRLSEQQAAEMTVVENLQREDLNCMEQAAAFAKLSRDFGLTQDQIGKRVGVSRESVSNYLRLLKLPGTVMQYLQNGELGFSEARELLRLDDDSQIAKMADQAIRQRWTLAHTQFVIDDIVVKRYELPQENNPGRARWVDPNVRAAQRNLEEKLGMRVRISDRKGKGKIVIEYGTLEDFDRVVGMLKGK